MELKMRNEVVKVALTDLAAGGTAKIDWNQKDDYTILVVTATTATTMQVLKGNGYAAVNDETLSIPVGTSVVKLESSRFKNITGENKGKIVIKTSGAIKYGVVAVV